MTKENGDLVKRTPGVHGKGQHMRPGRAYLNVLMSVIASALSSTGFGVR